MCWASGSRPKVGDKVFYFLQGHMEQVEAYNKDGKVEMPVYNLPSRILYKVVYVQLKAEAQTDDVFAHVTLLWWIGWIMRFALGST
ncbi:auxin response factor 11-like isoform X2 [Actinidia eriantha]|uniref:auxin response factor 11-like isoform X2 n=1 Tax=Actinidia eriantha TaxID=165200 RepID=UPI0025899567|nr:auxin response factor 11-like isoform X2 [Actinidia eriantha]XP_057460806.1 auxin response factor 11-like isoform X2 [Actinidia eriantha]